MIDVKKFIKEHLPLCLSTLGLAILGFLGYRAVKWIIHKCRKTENIDVLAQKNIHQTASQPLKPLIERVSKLQISKEKLTMGQGEYIVFHKLPNGEKKEPSPKLFEQVYKILLEHSPTALINDEKGVKACSNRYELLKASLKKLDPTLEAVFVPRTLYELVFIRKCIKEDLKYKHICPRLSSEMGLEEFQGNLEEFYAKLKDEKVLLRDKKCWHRDRFNQAKAKNDKAIGVRDVAYRLNNTILKKLQLSPEGLTCEEFTQFANKEISFLKTHYQNGIEVMKKIQAGEQVENISCCTQPGPTTNFGFESKRGSIKPMGIRNEMDAQIIRDAITLECSNVAEKAFLLYRGSDFNKDSPLSLENKNVPYSLSFGTSLFAGSLHDGGATAFHYMRNEPNAYAIAVPFDQLNTSPFYIPTQHAISQLFSLGEIFHARTRAWKNFDLKKIEGMNIGIGGHIRDHLQSDLTQTELINQFLKYKNQAIPLK